MTRLTALCLLALATASAPAQTPAAPPITPNEIDGHLRFLSSDLLEGRAPATRGGRHAAEDNPAHQRAVGVQPALNGAHSTSTP